MDDSSCARFYGNFKAECAIPLHVSSVTAIPEEVTATDSSDLIFWLFLMDINNKFSKNVFPVPPGASRRKSAPLADSILRNT
ncbi:hypothetical protein TNIN_101841 [Trichonephila inaurata madagascariensis]|uniref:Uncharacterized protein n=1 Tax=Trichonephila inaurata madagascariensis TaxID=2747483 RepID=A0A8X6Y9Z0_9ARAC|nr:hypothetical protein TNIN_101841 [Trichonephila inaurata madagascariensis]